jgi:hypothetical protein
MKSVHICFVLLVLGCVGIGAWLVVADHPWFAAFAMLIGASTSMSEKDT